MKRKKKPVPPADVLRRAWKDFESSGGIEHGRFWQIEMLAFLKASRADVDAGRTQPAMAAIDKLAKKYKLNP